MTAETEFFEHAAMVRDYSGMSLSEADTRVHLVDPILALLGYRGVSDIRREVSIPATRESVDYELLAGGQPQALVEAKAVRHPITDGDVAQCVQYASVLGVRWCLITNGVSWAIYDAQARGALSAKFVARLRLDQDAAGIAEAWAVLSLFSASSLAQSPPLTALLMRRVVSDELARADSPAIAALRNAVKDRFGERVSGQALVDIIREDELVRPGESPAITGSSRTERRAAPATRRRSSVLTELIDAGLLAPDAALECRLYGVTHAARIRDGQIDLEGTMYATPSAAASALRGGKASNGWVIWKYRGQLLADLRAQLLKQSPSDTGANQPAP